MIIRHVLLRRNLSVDYDFCKSTHAWSPPLMNILCTIDVVIKRSSTFLTYTYTTTFDIHMHSMLTLAIVISLGLSGLDRNGYLILRGTKWGTQNDVGGTATRCRVTSLRQRSPGIALQGGCDELQDAQSMQVMPNPSHMCVPSGHMCTIHRP